MTLISLQFIVLYLTLKQIAITAQVLEELSKQLKEKWWLHRTGVLCFNHFSQINCRYQEHSQPSHCLGFIAHCFQ